MNGSGTDPKDLFEPGDRMVNVGLAGAGTYRERKVSPRLARTEFDAAAPLQPKGLDRIDASRYRAAIFNASSAAMPNHVANEIRIFCRRNNHDAILADLLNADGEVDFSLMLPEPPDEQLQKQYPDEPDESSRLIQWRRDHWGTKWNAYTLDDSGEHEMLVDHENCFELALHTAGNRPNFWTTAFVQKHQVEVSILWLDEMSDLAVFESYLPDPKAPDGVGWEGYDETPDETDRMRYVHFGVDNGYYD